MGDGHHLGRDLTRRELLRRLAGTSAFSTFARCNLMSLLPILEEQSPQEKRPTGEKTFSDEDEALLQELEAANFRYFWEQTNPETGIVRDRCNVRTPDKNDLGSIAATGFGLTAICIGERRGFISHAEARERVLNTLRFHWRKLPNHRGFFYHWANINTGERLWDSEVSSIDTAILLCGMLTC